MASDTVSRMSALFFLVVLSLVVLACGEVGDRSSVPAAGSAGDAAAGGAGLNGTRWESVEVTGFTLPTGARVQLAFDADRFFAQIDCNHMAAPYTVDGDRLIVAYESTTETAAAACPRPRAEADAWFLNLVTSHPQVGRREDTLTLTGEDAAVVLQPIDHGAADGRDEPAEGISTAPGTATASTSPSPPRDSDGVTQSYSSPVIRVMAAAPTNGAASEGTIVSSSAALAEAWREAHVRGQPPDLPVGHVGVLVIAREIQSTCRSTGDVVNVEISGAEVVVRLHPDGEFARPCPGPTGSHAWTAFVVAIPEEIGASLATADVQLAESAAD